MQVVNIPKGKAGRGNQCRDEINHEAIKVEMMEEENMAFPAAGEESETELYITSRATEKLSNSCNLRPHILMGD